MWRMPPHSRHAASSAQFDLQAVAAGRKNRGAPQWVFCRFGDLHHPHHLPGSPEGARKDSGSMRFERLADFRAKRLED